MSKPHNKGTAKNIAYIEKQLRAGKTPEQLGGVKIGEGVCKAAYAFNGSFVVKLNAQRGFGAVAEKNPPAGLEKFNARGPRTYKVKQWIIQELVTPLKDQKTHKWNVSMDSEAYKNWEQLYRNPPAGLHDCHEYNCGVDKNGQLVVFDW